MNCKEFVVWCDKNLIVVSSEEPIAYGKQLSLSSASEKLKVNFYDSGKVLVQGKDSKLKHKVEGILNIAKKELKLEKTSASQIEDRKSILVGSDESGKGDYFGPLVVCAVHIHKKSMQELEKVGVRDSKKIRDPQIYKMAAEIKKYVDYSLISLSPSEYNFVYEQEKNLNILLAKLHIEVLTNLYKKTKFSHALVDQFAANKNFLCNLAKDLPVKIEQEFKAESHLSVACASVLAREGFLLGLDDLSRAYNKNFPKGASVEVEMYAKSFVVSEGVEALREVAKTHFATTKKILSI